MMMFLPGPSLSLVTSAATSAPISVVFSHSAWSRVVETTTFWKALIWAAIGSLVLPANEAAKAW